MFLKFGLGLVIACVTVWVVVTQLDVTGLIHALWHLPHHTLGAVITLGALSWLLRGLRTWVLFSEIPLFNALGMSFLHNAANNLAPMRLGELALPLLARWLGGVSFSVGLTHLLWIRLLDLISIVSVAGCVLLMPRFGISMVLLLAGLIFLMPLLLRSILPVTAHIRLPNRLHQVRAQLIHEARAGTRLHRVWRLTIVAWLCKLMGMGILLATLSGLTLAEVMGLILGAELSAILPIHGLAGTGTYQAGGMLGATLAGQSARLGLELAVQLHLYVLSLTLVFGILGALCIFKRTTHAKVAS